MDTNPQEEKNFLDYLIVLLKHKRKVFFITFGTALITAIISLLVPSIYQAGTQILPPQQNGTSIAQIFSGTGSMSMGGSILNLQTSDDLYVSLLESRTVLDRIIDRFDLLRIYNVTVREDARRKLLGAVHIIADPKSEIITIDVEDKDPKRAADMANAFVEELKNMKNGLALTGVGQRKLFFKKQMDDAKSALLNSENAMKAFQEKTGLVEANAQGEAVIEEIAQIKAQIAAQEVTLSVMKTYSTSSNPEFQKAHDTLKGLKVQAAKLESNGNFSDSGPIIPTGKMPAIQEDYLNKLRDIKFNETLYELLSKQYEAAGIEEAQDPTIIQIIDRAVVPQRRARPRRSLMVMVATVLGFFLSLILGFLFEYKEQITAEPWYNKKIDILKKHLQFRPLNKG